MFILKYLSVHLILFILILTFSKNVFADNQSSLFNEAPNSSFENGISEPTDWTKINGTSCNDNNQIPQAEQVWDSNIAWTGEKSLSLKNINWPGQSNGSVGDFNPIPGSWMSSDVPIAYPTADYTVKIWAKPHSANQNLSFIIWTCVYYEGTSSTTYKKSFPFFIPNNNSWGPSGYLKISPNPYYKTSKIRLGISAVCYSRGPCNGNLWFDDLLIKANSQKVTLHVFNDLNKNDKQETEEPNLPNFGLKLNEGTECRTDYPNAWSNKDGNITFTGLVVGQYAASVFLQEGWINTTPICQPLLISPNTVYQVNFGIIHGLTVPYLSQKDPLWGSNEYDHGNTIGPFFCGTTIGGCGCAITSSAMILKYHGATKSPTGEETSPDTLNSWLKNNNGYAFGALKWNSIAAYSVKANQNFGTQKIRFTGTSPPNNFSMLDSDLTNNNPAILEEPGHFIVAKTKQSPTYAINDPAFTNKTTLNAYSNNFLSMRRFEKTSTDLSAIYISTPAPNEILITDSLGRRTGHDPQSGQTFTEIPNSFYFLEPALINQTSNDPVSSQANSGVNMLVIINPDLGSYSLSSSLAGSIDFSSYDRGGDISVKEFSTINAEKFELNYSPEPGAEFNVFQKVDIKIQGAYPKKAGIVPVILKSDENFDISEVDLSTILFAQAETTKDKANLVSTGADGIKDLKVFFDAKSIDWTKDWCLTGQTFTQTEYKGCSP